MPYDPRMLQMAQRGIGMMGPQAGAFDRAEQPPRWWGQPPPQPQARPDDSNDPQPATQPPNPSKQPSLLEMMVDYGSRPRPQSRNAVQYGTARGSVTANPWAWLGSLGGPPR